MSDKSGPKLTQADHEWVPEAEYAVLIGRTRRTLRKWRQRGVGPPWATAGKTTMYRKSSWPEYLKSIEMKPARNTRLRTAEQRASI